MSGPRCSSWYHAQAAKLVEDCEDGYIHSFSAHTHARLWGCTWDDFWSVGNVAAAYHGIYTRPEPFQGVLMACKYPFRKALLGGYELVSEKDRPKYYRYGSDASLA